MTVNNVDPTASFTNDGPVAEGSSFTLTMNNADDASPVDKAAGFTFAFDCGDGSGYGAFTSTPTQSATKSCSTNDNGTRNVKAKIRDKNGGEREYTGSVTVNNIAPSVTLNGAASANEGETVSYNYTWTDPGSGDTFPAAGNSVDCGPKGTASDKVFDSASKTGSFKCTFSDDSGSGTFAVSATVTDDDGDSGSDTKQVDVDNLPPTAVDDNPAAVDEGESVNLNVLDNDTDPAGSNDPLTVTNNTDGQNGTVNCAPDGSCTYTPDPDFFGTDSFTYTVSDGDGGTSVGTVNVTINPVNDAPSFDIPADPPAVNEDASAQTVNSLATGISAGPANESGQTVSFGVTNNTNTSLFSAQPSIDPANGNLTYTPAADANGTAQVTVVLKDGGGTANGGVDTSAAKTFTITINPVNDKPSFTSQGNDQVDEDSGPRTVAGWVTNFNPARPMRTASRSPTT